MSQFLRPDGTITQSNFTNNHTAIDESTASDSDFAYSADNALATLEVSLSNPSGTPGSGTNTVRYRQRLVNNGIPVGAAIIGDPEVTVRLVQGTTILVSGTMQEAIGGSWAQHSFTFASSLVSDWNDLRLRFNVSASASSMGAGISWAEVEAQNAVAAVDITPTGIHTDSPSSTNPTVAQTVWGIVPTSVGSGAPVVGSPGLTTPTAIDPSDVGTAEPGFTNPTIGSALPPNIVPVGIHTGPPVLGELGVFINEYPIDPDRLHTGRPVLGTPVVTAGAALPPSTRYAQFFFNSSSCIVQVECVEFIHPDFSTTHRAVRNVTAGCTVKHENGVSYPYAYYPMRIVPSKITNDLDFGLKLEFGDLGELLPAELDLIAQADGYATKPIVKLRVYRSDDLNTILHGPLVLEVTEFNFTKEGSSFEALAKKMNISKTGEIYTLTRFPILRGFL